MSERVRILEKPERGIFRAPKNSAAPNGPPDPSEQIRAQNIKASRQMAVVLSGLADKEFRLAALNLIEDAEEARRRTLLEAEERQRAQDSLRASQQRLDAALSAGRMATWDWDPESDTVTGSENIKEVLGLPPGADFQASVRGFKLIYPDDLRRHRETVHSGASLGRGWHHEFRIIRPKDGQIAWLEERAHAARDPRTGKVALSGVVWDITERKRADEALRENAARLRLILESAVEYAIFSLDLERRIITWSAGAERLFGYETAEIVGQRVDILFAPEDRDAGAPEQGAQSALKEGRSADERWHVHKNGERFWGSGVIAAMQGPDEQVFGFVEVVRNHTEAKRHEDAVAALMGQLENALGEAQRARIEAEEANRAKDTFLAALSHELRTPLTPVIMTTESLLKQPGLSQRVRDGLQLICRNIELEAHFINDLLDLTRIARGKFDLARQPVDLHEVIHAAIEVCRADLEAKDQQLSVNLEATQRIIPGDAPRLQQVFWNLLKNASKFTSERGEIHIRSRDEGDQIVVTISDTGIGIPRESLTDIFEAFRQADSTIARKYGGLGLGLAISRATIEALGGAITAESAGPGSGATFTVRLPVRLRQEDEEK